MKNKKAMFFTILAIIILSIFLMTYTIYSVAKNTKSVSKRVTTMNNFLFSTEQDLPRQLYISGFRVIFVMNKKITETGQYIPDFDSQFQEAFFNGTLNGEYQDLMQGAIYSSIESSTKEKADHTNINLTLSSPSVSAYQEDPWHVKVVLTVNLIAKDKADLAEWNKTETITAYIPVESFEDPLYTISTNSLVSNKIRKTNLTFEDLSNLLLHTQNSYYINSTLAPSFIDRIEGKTTPSANGIESLVYLPKLSAQGISVKDKSCVDYIYFSSDNPSFSGVSGMPSWFKLDSNHINIYT